MVNLDLVINTFIACQVQLSNIDKSGIKGIYNMQSFSDEVLNVQASLVGDRGDYTKYADKSIKLDKGILDKLQDFADCSTREQLLTKIAVIRMCSEAADVAFGHKRIYDRYNLFLVLNYNSIEEIQELLETYHEPLMASLSKKYKGKEMEVLIQCKSLPTEISDLDIGELNRILGTDYNYELINGIVSIMYYEICNLNISYSLDDTKSKLIKLYQNSLQQSTLYWIDSLKLENIIGDTIFELFKTLRYRADNNPSHWPNIPIAKEFIEGLASIDITETVLNKLKMIGVETYKSIPIRKAIELQILKDTLKHRRNRE